MCNDFNDIDKEVTYDLAETDDEFIIKNEDEVEYSE